MLVLLLAWAWMGLNLDWLISYEKTAKAPTTDKLKVMMWVYPFCSLSCEDAMFKMNKTNAYPSKFYRGDVVYRRAVRRIFDRIGWQNHR